jgi:2-succinyl-6-hydroxy-2,4-cyclohexadiene-1-carboxylate synthase
MTLVLLHGFTGSPASWDTVVVALGGPAPLRLELLGHGARDTESVKTFEDEVLRLLAKLPGEPVHLAGYSLGARLALALSLAAPERVRRLTLVSGQSGLAIETEREERRRADARWSALLETRGIAAFVDAWEAQPLFATQTRLPPDSRARRRAERLGHDPLELARSLRVTGLGAMPDLGPALGSLRVPITLMAGELDQKFVALGRAMSTAAADARLVLAPNAGHDLLLEAPDLVARELGRET